MANCLMGFPNRIDAAALSGGTWSATLPRTNIQNRVLGKVARTLAATLASTQFDLDMVTAKTTKVLALVNHNFSLSALVRIRGSAVSNFATTEYDSGWVPVWPAVYASSETDWEDDNWWSGQYTDEQRAGYTAAFVQVLPNIVRARYWRVEVDDTTNAAGYVQVGRVFIGPAWQPLRNMSYGAAIGWETKTAAQEALGGAEYFQRRTPYRVQNISLNWMSVDEGLGSAFEIQRRAGIDADVLWVFDPDDTIHALRRRFLGRLRELSPVQHPYPLVNATAFQIKEIL
ncbi:hypothetical protein [Polaromonas sp.]|uniref:hypothetical protein n=1 Tax=Polaromonas sp. TaxID=1869339 RepID=UPI00356350B3